MEIHTLSIIGLGYVGLPLAAAFSEQGIKVIGYDCNVEKIKAYKDGIDPTNEIGSIRLKQLKNIIFTHDASQLSKALFHIVAVPTPDDINHEPNLKPLLEATVTLSKYLKPNSIVVYESTVYPGTTEEICVPALEQGSGLKYKEDFNVGYSPERINPGDHTHTLENIIKVVAASNQQSLQAIRSIYDKIVKAGTYAATSIKVAEAAKLIENCQRDVNIAFINEASMVFNKLNIPINEVIEAASTKWNFQTFMPGLVGGHCISVDPYYFIYKAKALNIEPKVIQASRAVNEGMGIYIVNKTIEFLKRQYNSTTGLNVLLMGVTFKENVPDLRNSKVLDIMKYLDEKGITVYLTDPIANEEEVYKETGKALITLEDAKDIHGIIICVAHSTYRTISPNQLKAICSGDKPTLIDVKGIFNREDANEFEYWQL